MNLIGIKTMAFHALYDGVPRDSKEADGKYFKTKFSCNISHHHGLAVRGDLVHMV